jgi:hypothetical protein
MGEFGRPRFPVTEQIAGFKSRWGRKEYVVPSVANDGTKDPS